MSTVTNLKLFGKWPEYLEAVVFLLCMFAWPQVVQNFSFLKLEINFRSLSPPSQLYLPTVNEIAFFLRDER